MIHCLTIFSTSPGPTWKISIARHSPFSYFLNCFYPFSCMDKTTFIWFIRTVYDQNKDIQSYLYSGFLIIFLGISKNSFIIHNYTFIPSPDWSICAIWSGKKLEVNTLLVWEHKESVLWLDYSNINLSNSSKTLICHSENNFPLYTL